MSKPSLAETAKCEAGLFAGETQRWQDGGKTSMLAAVQMGCLSAGGDP